MIDVGWIIVGGGVGAFFTSLLVRSVMSLGRIADALELQALAEVQKERNGR